MLIFYLEKLFSNYTCSFKKYTGLYCPSCGGLRSSLAFMKGDIVESIRFNPIVVYIFSVILIYIIINIKNFLLKKKLLGSSFIICALILGFIIIFLNFIIKNYYLIYKGIDLMPY